MKYVLFLIMITDNRTPFIITHEFTSKVSCEVAGQKFITTVDKNSNNVIPGVKQQLYLKNDSMREYYCVEK